MRGQISSTNTVYVISRRGSTLKHNKTTTKPRPHSPKLKDNPANLQTTILVPVKEIRRSHGRVQHQKQLSRRHKHRETIDHNHRDNPPCYVVHDLSHGDDLLATQFRISTIEMIFLLCISDLNHRGDPLAMQFRISTIEMILLAMQFRISTIEDINHRDDILAKQFRIASKENIFLLCSSESPALIMQEQALERATASKTLHIVAVTVRLPRVPSSSRRETGSTGGGGGRIINLLSTNPNRLDGQQTVRIIRVKDIPLSVDDSVILRSLVAENKEGITIIREKLRVKAYCQQPFRSLWLFDIIRVVLFILCNIRRTKNLNDSIQKKAIKGQKSIDAFVFIVADSQETPNKGKKPIASERSPPTPAEVLNDESKKSRLKHATPYRIPIAKESLLRKANTDSKVTCFSIEE
ncbi:hypothetical protein MAR_013295 [Mya arenaria]|uniref:Uncharacterized protein n=1 Tax=Mya arenaria TaxID=6604 RepID=A0ABY7G3I5_MYAAR|nr:hypothetical protein MAR_013295 [Mya arenaria]